MKALQLLYRTRLSKIHRLLNVDLFFLDSIEESCLEFNDVTVPVIRCHTTQNGDVCGVLHHGSKQITIIDPLYLPVTERYKGVK
jgi:hypothetical protein